MIHNVHLVAQSGNTKTGPIPVTYRDRDTCPTDCPFLRNGCYGDGRIFALAHKFSRSLSQSDALAILARVRKGTRVLRDRVVGDIVNANGGIDFAYLRSISRISAKAGLTPFGYTHAWKLFTRADVRKVRNMGYVLNASCETPQDVEQALTLGFKPVITNDDTPEGMNISGHRVVTCPAQTRDNVTCAHCRLCAKPDLPVVVRFLVHGPSKSRARAAIARRVTTSS